MYVARLMSEHPLYDQARRLSQEMAALQRPLAAPTPPAVALELGELFLPGPELPRFPLEHFDQQRREWQLSLLPDQAVQPTELAPDLAAELAWERARAERRASQEITRVRAEEDDRVAQVRAAAVRARQEALNNAGLDLSIRGREAAIAAARKARDELWAEIEQETTGARQDAEARIAQTEARIAAELEQRVATVTADVWGRMRKRAETALKSGSETKSRMSNRLALPQPLPLEGSAVWQPTTGVPTGPLRPALEAMRAADRRTRAAQVARLAAARGALEARIYEAVALAALRVGGLHNWDLALPPDEPARGQDMTEAVRTEVRRMFRPEPVR